MDLFVSWRLLTDILVLKPINKWANSQIGLNSYLFVFSICKSFRFIRAVIHVQKWSKSFRQIWLYLAFFFWGFKYWKTIFPKKKRKKSLLRDTKYTTKKIPKITKIVLSKTKTWGQPMHGYYKKKTFKLMRLDYICYKIRLAIRVDLESMVKEITN